MKRRTTPHLPVKLNIDRDLIDSIDFIFKLENSESAVAKLEKSFPEDVEYDADTQLFIISLTQDETVLFPENKEFYMDTRILLTNGEIPETNIVSLWMKPTLFSSNS